MSAARLVSRGIARQAPRMQNLGRPVRFFSSSCHIHFTSLVDYIELSLWHPKCATGDVMLILLVDPITRDPRFIFPLCRPSHTYLDIVKRPFHLFRDYSGNVDFNRRGVHRCWIQGRQDDGKRSRPLPRGELGFCVVGGNGWEWQGARDVAWEMQLDAKTEESTQSVRFLLE